MRVILNPMARHGAGRRLRPVIERGLEQAGFEFELIETRDAGHATALAADAVRDGIDRVVAAGGDGTIHEVINGLMSAQENATGPGPALGLIPIGTGNDFVKMMPGAETVDSAIRTLTTGAQERVDVGLAEWSGGREYFANAMGTGIDVEVVRGMRRSSRLPGGMIYVGALLRALVRYEPMEVLITIDETAWEPRRIMNLAVCNGPSIGGSFRICPDAVPDDGLLDMCVIGEMSLVRNALLTPRVIAGTHAGKSGVTMARGRRARLAIAEDRELWFQLDGELRSTANGRHGLEISITQGLNVIRTPARVGASNGAA